MSNLTDVIGRPGFNGGTLTATRKAAGTVTNGRYTVGASSTFSFYGAVQPMGSSLKALPEGYAAEDGRRIYTTTQLVKLPFPDEVTIDGEVFVVSHVDGPWTGFGGTHYCVTVARKNRPGAY